MFKWTPDCQTAFDNLKKLLTNPPVLGYPVPGQRFILDTDACQFSVGAVHSQVQNGNDRVIAYMSKSINQHEQRYCTTRKELLAAITGLKTFHSYLYEQEILLRTDNIAVSWLQSLKAPNGQIARWLQQLETYNITTEHRAGKFHVTADALSRKPCTVCQRQTDLNTENQNDETERLSTDDYVCCTTIETNELCLCPAEAIRVITRSEQARSEDQLKFSQETLVAWQPAEIRVSQLNDSDIAILMVAIEDGADRPVWNKVSPGTSSLKTLWQQWDRLVVRAGMLFTEFMVGETGESILQLVVPTC